MARIVAHLGIFGRPESTLTEPEQVAMRLIFMPFLRVIRQILQLFYSAIVKLGGVLKANLTSMRFSNSRDWLA